MHPLRFQALKLWNTFKPQSYRPVIPRSVDHAVLLRDIAEATGSPQPHVERLWGDYRELAARQKHAETLGEIGTTSTEEAFALHCLLDLLKPAHLVEIGAYEGASTRRILDSIAHLQLPTRVTTFDIVDLARHFQPDEARLILQDVTDSVGRDILEAFEPGIIYLDAHPWRLLQNVLRAVLRREDWILAIHDCSPVLCNPRMTIPKDEPRLISARTGHWERHVLADVFGLADPLDLRLDQLDTARHRLRVLGTQHGLALVLPKAHPAVK